MVAVDRKDLQILLRESMVLVDLDLNSPVADQMVSKLVVAAGLYPAVEPVVVLEVQMMMVPLDTPQAEELKVLMEVTAD